MTEVRTRFAPSPTGSIHLGNLRVAIFNHLFARHHGGTFVLRVEDTDFDRNVEGALEEIMDDLRWAGLEWDEGPDVGGPHAPYRQSERGEVYREVALRLRESGSAYPCFCSDEAVEAARVEGRPGPGCPGGCRELSEEEASVRQRDGTPPVLRFSVPSGRTSISDEVRGDITFDNKDIGDFIILRGDGRPTYNFAVVVDDVSMRITHVIRGSGHISNTPKQALLFDAIGAPRPVFAHLPMVLDSERRKLSKREGAEGVRKLREEGYPPDGVVNYLSLLGWSPGDDREILDRRELVEAMDLGRIGASDTVYDPEKFEWVCAQHLARMGLSELVAAVVPWIDRSRFDLSGPEAEGAIEALRTRLSTFAEVNEHLDLVFPAPDVLAAGRAEIPPEAAPTLRAVRDRLTHAQEWTPDELSTAVREAGKGMGAKGRDLFHPVRLAVSGVRQGPDLGLVLAAQGRERVLEALERSLPA
ncbi:MAG: glutamate--tRNA ligase [Gemmatimonadota bacterium]